MKSLESFIARRYLLSKRKIRFINVIGIISVTGITVGVAALLIALSVFNGFNGVVTSVLVGFDPHIRIEKKGNIDRQELQNIEQTLTSVPEVKGFSPFVSGKAMLVAGSFNRVVYLRGIDAERIAEVSGLKEKLILGSLAPENSDEAPGIVIGLTLADRLSAVVGNEITIVSPTGFESAISGVGIPEMKRFRVTGIFESNNKEYDGSYAYVSVGSAQELFNTPGAFNGVEIRLQDFHESERIKDALVKLLPADLSVSSWYDLHKTLYSVMQIERWAAYILLSLIIVVATFNMLGSLTMGVIEKRRDIGVLKAMGMTSRRVIRTFMFEGMLIGVAGTLFGILIGLGVLFLQIQFHIFPLDTSVYIIPAIPVEIHWLDFISIAFSSLGLSFLAAYYPARRAAETIPSESLRWE